MSRAGNLVFVVWCLALTTYFGTRAAFIDPAVADGFLGERASLLIGGPSKLLALLLTAVFALQVGRSLEEDNPARRSWVLVGLGFGAFSLGQAVLVVHQLGIEGPTPFPSPADPVFILGYAAMFAALVGFVRTFAGSGLAVASNAALLRVGGLAGIGFLAIGVAALLPSLRSDAPLIERVVGAAYPALDCILLVPIALMTRITVSLRGSQLAGPWVRLLLGFLAISAGDVMFALGETLSLTGLDASLDLAFTVGYVLAAWGCHAQLRLVR